MEKQYPLTCKTGEFVTNYEEYLQTAHWKGLRLQLAKREDNKCQHCGKTVLKGFHGHHKTYKNIGNEKLSDLLFLCGDCHAKHHEIKKNKRKEKSKKIPSESSDESKEAMTDRIYDNIIKRIKKMDYDRLVRIRDLINSMIGQ